MRKRGLPLTFLCLVGCGSGERSGAAPPGQQARERPADSSIGAAVINIERGRAMPDTLLALAHVRTAEADVLRLEAIAPDDSAQATRIVAERPLPALEPEEYVALGSCSVAGVPDITVTAIVRPGPHRTQERVRVAWRVDLTRRTIDDLPTDRVDCVDEDAEP